MGTRLSNVTALRGGTALVLVGIVLVLATSAFRWDALVIAAAWVVGGAGMGLMSPRSSVLTLSLSTPANQGFNSAAMTVADSFGSALVLAITGTIFAALATTADPFTALFALTALIAAVAVVLAPRVATVRVNEEEAA